MIPELDFIGGKLLSMRSWSEDDEGVVITRLDPRGENDGIALTGDELSELLCLIAGLAGFQKAAEQCAD